MVFDPPPLELLLNVRVPEDVPVVLGENAMPMDVDWLGCRVRGRLVCPARLKLEPETAMLETVIRVALVLVS